MRNYVFVPLVMQLVGQAPGVAGVQTLAEVGEHRYPLGFVVKGARGETRWQAIQQLAYGESHDNPAAEIEGLPAAWEDMVLTADGWLAAVIGRARMPQIARIVVWSRQPDGDSGEGVTVHFHNGARSFLRRI